MIIRLICLTLLLSLFADAATAKTKLTKLKLKTAKHIKIPKQFEVGGLMFKKTDTQKYDNPGLGAVVMYESKEHPSLLISYYIYPMSSAPVSIEWAMDYEFAYTNQGINQVHSMDDGQVVELERNLTDLKGTPALFARYNLTAPTNDRISEFYLAGRQFHYLKIRASYPTMEANEIKQLIPQAATMIYQATEFKKAVDVNIAMSLNPNQDENTITASSIAFLMSTLAKLNEDNLISNFANTKAVYESVEKIESSLTKEKGEPNPYLSLETIKMAGYLDEHIWANHHQFHWHQPDDLALDAYVQWLEEQDKAPQEFSQFGALAINYD